MNGAKVIVIDDEREIGLLLGEALRDEGYACEVATNGFKALEILETFKPNLVICDLMMPIMTGPELIARIRELPSYANLPVILMSAATPKEKPTDHAWTVFIQKPFNLDRFLNIVSDCLAKK